MLPDSDIVERVILGRLASDRRPRRAGGLLASLPPGATLIDMSSSDPARTKILAALTAASGVTLIDAPVSGGVAGARAGTLAVMVGGPAESFERFKPMLSAIGKRVVHAGDVGAGHAVKALNNLMSAAHLLVSSEALIAGQRFGARPRRHAGNHQRLKRPLRLHREQVAQLRPHRQVRRRLRHAPDGQGHQAGPGHRARHRASPRPPARQSRPPGSPPWPTSPPERDHTAIARWLCRAGQSSDRSKPVLLGL